MGKFELSVLVLGIFGALSTAENVPGGKQPLTDEDALNKLTSILNTHLPKLELVQIFEATSQLLATNEEYAGIRYDSAHSTDGNYGGIRYDSSDDNAGIRYDSVHSTDGNYGGIRYDSGAGIRYEMVAEIKENATPFNCTIILFEKPLVPDFIDLDVKCGEGALHYEYIAGEVHELNIDGGYSVMSDSDIQSVFPEVKKSFEKLASTETEFDVVFSKILSGTSQLVAGMNYKLIVEAKKADEVTNCAVDIRENLAGQFVRVKVKCDHKNKEFSYETQ